MKALFLTQVGNHVTKERGKLDLRDIPIPKPGPEEILIKVSYASVCGSDGHMLLGNLGCLGDIISASLPMRMGHEMSGVIQEVGATAAQHGFQPGDRVTANYTHFCGSCYFCHTGRENFCMHPDGRSDAMSEYVCWHMSQVYHLPPTVPLLDGSLTEPLSIALGAVEMVQVGLGSHVLVFGCGGIGLMAIQLAKLAGAALVTAVEPVAEKRKIALENGADFAVDPTQEGWKDEALQCNAHMGYDAVIESSGASSAAQSSISLMGPDSHAVYFAMYDPNFNIQVNPFNELYLGQKHLHGLYTTADSFEKTVRILPRMNFKPIVQKIYAIDDYEKAFADQTSGKYAKIVFQMDQQN